ncbi:sodium/glucose cotransporter 1-like [Echinops telfairi]|uniref:Sodium/glucose cotransporter 1-like n=1 Tax=Echinops telfairi TaxID=9371 RepID=A0ABM0J764_ECHTE|nr:sodium/glucose cotransporter 1-like [Echinops telfairi]
MAGDQQRTVPARKAQKALRPYPQFSAVAASPQVLPHPHFRPRASKAEAIVSRRAAMLLVPSGPITLARPWHGLLGNWSLEGYHPKGFDLALLIFFFLGVLGVGLWKLMSSNRSTVQDFFLAGRNLSWWLIGASLYATNVSSNYILGLAGVGASSGIAVVAFEWNAVLLLFVLSWVFAPIYVKAGVVTVSEYLKKRFGGCRIHIFFSILTLCLYVFNRISVNIVSCALFMRLIMGLDVYFAILILLTVSGIYTITGGFITMIYTNTLHGLVMFWGSILLMIFAFKDVGGYQGLRRSYPNAIPSIISEGNWTARPECYTPRPDSFHIFRHAIHGDLPWPGIVFGLSTLTLYSCCIDQVVVQQCLAGKSLNHVRASCILCGYLKLLAMFTIVMLGMISRVLFTDKVACVVPSECLRHCGTSTGCSFIAYPILMVKLLPSCKFFTILLLAVSLVWVPAEVKTQDSLLVDYMQSLTIYLAPPIAAVFLLAIFCKRVNEKGAFWGMVSGLLIGISRLAADFVYGPQNCNKDTNCPAVLCSVHFLYFDLILFTLSLLITLGVSLLTDPIPDKHLHGLCWSLRNSPEERVDLDIWTQKKCAPKCRPLLGMSREKSGCLWKVWELFCGLEPRLSSKLAPMEPTPKELSPGELSPGLMIPGELIPRDLILEELVTKKVERRELLETPWGRKLLQASEILLMVLLVLGHIIFF